MAKDKKRTEMDAGGVALAEKPKKSERKALKARQKAEKEAKRLASTASAGTSEQAKKDERRRAKKSAAAGGFKHVAKKKLSTGKGATASEIGTSLVDLFNQGRTEEVERRWHSKRIESIEADGSVFLGRKGIAEKNAWWYSTYEVHSMRAEGPFVGATGFVVHFELEVSPKAGGDRVRSREVGVYTVSKGKIVREEFMNFAGAR